MEAVKVKRGYVKGMVTRIMAFAENIPQETTKEAIQSRLEKLEGAWKEFFDLQNQLAEYLDEVQYASQEAEIIQFENKYYEARENLLTAFNSRRRVESSDSSATHQVIDQQNLFFERLSSTLATSSSTSNRLSDTRLPKLEIPHFSGRYNEWMSFRDLFESTIHTNHKLSDSQKLHYLKGFLQGDAAALLRHIPITNANYQEAWERLNARYENKKQIVNSFVQGFLSLAPISTTSFIGLRKLTDGVDEMVRGLKALGKEAEGRDPWIIYLLMNKVDVSTQQTWAEHTTSMQSPSIKDLITFLNTRCQALENCQANLRQASVRPQPSKVHQATSIPHIRSHTASMTSCPKCQQNHCLFQCPSFQNLSIDSRRTFVNQQKLCFNCLRKDHKSSQCKSQHRCRHCQQRHHSLVHQDRVITATNINKSDEDSHTTFLHEEGVVIRPTQALIGQKENKGHTGGTSTTLLPTAVASVLDCSGNKVPCRVLIDSGSQASFITESLVQKLGLPRYHARIPVSGLTTSSVGVTKGRVVIQLTNKHNKTMHLEALILPCLTSNIPETKLTPIALLKSYSLADPYYNQPRPVDIILGADRALHILKNHSKLITEDLILQLTEFGWVIAGNCNTEKTMVRVTPTSINLLHTTLDIDRSLKQFWELEESKGFELSSTAEELQAEHIFTTTTKRTSDGRYIVQLPFKGDPSQLGHSHSTALKRLHSIERKCATNPKLSSAYLQFMNEYLTLGHMEKIPHEEIMVKTCYYLPHHAVFKQIAKESKVRVVFDGSSKTSTNVSLNDLLLVGPPIQRDLFAVCLRFRMYKFTFTADIEKMFRQIWIADDQRDYQRILWRKSSSNPVEYYRLKTVTYGTASAPYLAVRVLEQLASEIENRYPKATQVLRNNCYVDDILAGAHSVSELVDIQHEITTALAEAGFSLRKWSSNCKQILSAIPENHRALREKEFMEEEQQSVKTLGLKWSPSLDIFSFTIRTSSNGVTTKRKFLSEASRIFDPLGFLTPITVSIKILFQSLWLQDVGWDDLLPHPIAEQWMHIQQELPIIDQLKISRWIGLTDITMELHGFSDASEKVYSAVIYARSRSPIAGFRVHLVAAKSRVAPLKQISIARLELCGALLLTKLFERIVTASSKHHYKLFAWTDSEIVLHWLSTQPRKWNTFVANRTSEILSTLPRDCWRHVASIDNPADCASRGVTPHELMNHSLWWNGPSWLQQHESVYLDQDSSNHQVGPKLAIAEERPTRIQALITRDDSEFLTALILKFSSWLKLLRIIAYCIRFMSNGLKRNSPISLGPLTCVELDQAKQKCIRHVQKITFNKEIESLHKGQPLSANNKLSSLRPFIDENNLLRVGGRLQHSQLSYATKHPIILPKDSHLSELIVNYYHMKYCHASITETFTLLREEYWIVNARNMIRRIVHHCHTCIRYRHVQHSQLMGTLPQSRVCQEKPFANTGCDYAGPISLRCLRGRNPHMTKGYICVFICMATKAMHLELASDLTTNTFLACLRRFISRRGRCKQLFSDNATNFRGAKRKLNEMYQLVLSNTHHRIVQETLAQEGVQWSFIPPNAPHFGGLWEAGVKSVKTHLRRVIGNNTLTFEALNTLLVQIEGILNSRPLFAMPDQEFEPLTPFHLLTGYSYQDLPEPHNGTTELHLPDKWRLVQAMRQGFWKRWHKEYLTSLQQRPKWKQVQPNFNVNDIVLIKDSNSPPGHWPMAKVIKAHPGEDGQVRVVTLITATGIIQRPIVKLIRLPSRTSSNSIGPNMLRDGTEVSGVHEAVQKKVNRVVN